ncbi:hypothetical protein EMIHUDRAFT_114210 [Emiliania huxleyi CCMP1516]|uniref:PWWP domain-containing protein n=2 Tax=Emiliania huxleyi TaxID=2903 RepID=A0A0D3JXQ1_EMIH1|nr:hypothetical protein EMIHUDRAFT_114210 [Emiliania huxleyi CCMP1516]EOD28286.1 hypothetical protein EMIHUDRAFT_114210 [Emiliania huxleyi CCMP1516]|eukprot:XP_005780715.1 hypothetical protein EMIHUDRAFT_114210 [Emiliania huxleyi CCMP1516]
MVYLGSFATAVEAAVAYARAVGEYQPPAPPTVATEAEGLRLHLSSSSNTGYTGVFQHASGHRSRFQAQHRVGGRKVSLGYFDSAVEAAVAYARAARGYQPPAQPPPTVATEAEGLRLHLSSSNATGYIGVNKHRSSCRFWAQHRAGGRQVSLGSFDTAVEAAVAYERAVGQAEAAGAAAAVSAEEGDEAGGEEEGGEEEGGEEEGGEEEGGEEEGGEESGWSGGGEEESHFQVGGRVAVQYSDGALYPGEIVGFDGASSLYSVQCDDGELLEDVSLHEMLREAGEGEWEEQERASGEGMEAEEAEAAAGSAGSTASPPPPPPPTHREAAPAAPLVTEAEGLRLHLSSSSSTGYRGVYEHSGRYQAKRWVDGKEVYLGSFATAVEAAVAYARAVGEYQPPPAPPTVAAEAEGLRLHLSSSNSIGYKNVRENGARFKAEARVDGKRVCFGTFATAVEAAVAYARAVGQAEVAGAGGPARAAALAGEAEAGETEEEEAAEAREMEAMEAEEAEEATAAAAAAAEGAEGAPEEEEAAEAAGTAAVSAAAPLATEAEGLRLHLSSSNATGYRGVCADRSRYQAKHRAGERMVYLGTFATAVEAAVAYARAVGEAEAAGAGGPARAAAAAGDAEAGEAMEAAEAREMEAMEAEEAEEAAAAAAAEEEEGAEGAPEEEEAAKAAGTAAVSAAAPLATEAEGLRLHLSSSNATGYRGVREHSGRYQAKHRAGERMVYLGTFATAVEAAVAYARAAGEYQPPAPPTVATEAEGLRLHVSSITSTGYKGVHADRSRYQATHSVGGKQVYLGSFATAVEAAVAYARAVGEAEAAGAGGPARAAAAAGDAEAGEAMEAAEAREMEAMEAEEAEEAAAAAEEEEEEGAEGAPEEEEAAEAAGTAAVSAAAPLATEAEGLRLHLSSSNATGYRGVREHSGRYQAKRGGDCKEVYLGNFATAVEAAVAYARAVGEYQPPAPPTVATEAEGLRLHVSSITSTGYKGVHADRSRFRAEARVGGKQVYLGTFATAVEAAVAYARAVGQAEAAGAGGPARAAALAGEAEAGETEEEEAAEAREMEAMEAEEAEEAAAAAAEEEEDVPPQAEGLRLHLSGCTGSAGLAAGSPCWAKLRDSPWWPAVIRAEEEGESVRVHFYGTGNVASLERASCIKPLREDERLFDATRWGKEFGRPKWKHLRAPFASAVAQALEVEAALPHAPPGALSRGPAGSSADNARRCDERPPKRRRTSAAQEAVQMVADLETADVELDAPLVRRCAVTLDRCLPSRANRGAAPPRLGIGDGWAASAASSWVSLAPPPPPSTLTPPPPPPPCAALAASEPWRLPSARAPRDGGAAPAPLEQQRHRSRLRVQASVGPLSGAAQGGRAAAAPRPLRHRGGGGGVRAGGRGGRLQWVHPA